MKILYRNTNALLFEKVNSLVDAPNSWRCIHLNLNGKGDHYSPMVRTYFIVKGFAETLQGEDGYIYLCSDGDIFILFQGAARPLLTKLAKHFGDIDIDRALDKNNDSLFRIYDLAKDWDEFFTLCFTKSMQTEAWDDAPSNYFTKYVTGLRGEELV
jgi:hypothetical protein